ncbi:glycosyltransferase [Paenibacillus sp. N3/727]|uniref:glycosyltransferase family 2 protein n=1 Tax=Paenibacillus sp. N3/727 TaxID=2925845 RepID=UPI001F5343C7|nr:glycosyltransferase family 2 protein [Paenibacillus sp. N3/727]UNK19767.1 glycosyltransferase [Paenibacillus sp. N3/727]
MNRVHDNQGYNDGYLKGFDTGYADGYRRGKTEGATRSTTYFEGTSIIIPTYNQLHYLKECIESILRYTNEPYELIIIDNASVDGTAEYLKSAQGVRFRINEENLGFAGAVNQGLMMAKGTTLMILNNDSVVTTNWLSNLLACLFSNSQSGIVGPVTNYISGDQLIDVSYTNTEEMQQFSQLYNQSDARRWSVTNRLTGFCMLLRRKDFIRLGYFDEGFEIGNCEDDDYGLRARLLGMQLIIAKDTFIHHYGSVSMKSLNSRFDQVYANNLNFYSNKWSDPHGMLLLDWQRNMDNSNLQTIDSYPTCVIVQGAGSRKYWIEKGSRYPIDGASGIQAVRVSQVDLRNWHLGETISMEEVNRRKKAMYDSFHDDWDIEGRLVKVRDGSVFQRKGNKLHRFLNRHTSVIWHMDSYQPLSVNLHELGDYEEGAPVIPPPVIKADNI